MRGREIEVGHLLRFIDISAKYSAYLVESLAQINSLKYIYNKGM